MINDKGIIKECVPTPDKDRMVFVLRTEHLDNSLKYYIDLFEEAKKDFPKLETRIVKAYLYQGDTHKGQRGIEFSVAMPCKIPDGYVDGIRLIDAC